MNNDTLFNKYIVPCIGFVKYAVDKYYWRNRRLSTCRRDDMIQECLIKLWQTIHRYNPDSSITSWIESVVRYTVMDNHEKVNSAGYTAEWGEKSNLKEISHADFEYALLFNKSDSHNEITAYNVPEDEYLTHCSVVIQRAVNSLSALHRGLFMGVLLGYSMKEVGDKLVTDNIISESDNNNKNLLLQYCLAIKQLRELLQQYRPCN